MKKVIILNFLFFCLNIFSFDMIFNVVEVEEKTYGYKKADAGGGWVLIAGGFDYRSFESIKETGNIVLKKENGVLYSISYDSSKDYDDYIYRYTYINNITIRKKEKELFYVLKYLKGKKIIVSFFGKDGNLNSYDVSIKEIEE